MTTNATDEAYVTDDAHGANWHLMLGDSCERLAEIPDDQHRPVGLQSAVRLAVHVQSVACVISGTARAGASSSSITGSSSGSKLRVTKPGRNACVHVQQLTTTKATDGYIGLTDFRGEVIRAYSRTAGGSSTARSRSGRTRRRRRSAPRPTR